MAGGGLPAAFLIPEPKPSKYQQLPPILLCLPLISWCSPFPNPTLQEKLPKKQTGSLPLPRHQPSVLGSSHQHFLACQWKKKFKRQRGKEKPIPNTVAATSTFMRRIKVDETIVSLRSKSCFSHTPQQHGKQEAQFLNFHLAICPRYLFCCLVFILGLARLTLTLLRSL